MKKLLPAFIALSSLLFSSCIVLPDNQGGYYTYPVGDDEIEYTRPDGSKAIITQDGTVKKK